MECEQVGRFAAKVLKQKRHYFFVVRLRRTSDDENADERDIAMAVTGGKLSCGGDCAKERLWVGSH